MNYSLELRQEATIEFTESYIWYEEQQSDLGKAFKIAIDHKLKQICKSPYHYKTSYKNYHEAVVDKFPFLIVYTIDEKDKRVTIFAIFHTSRNPKKKYLR